MVAQLKGKEVRVPKTVRIEPEILKKILKEHDTFTDFVNFAIGKLILKKKVKK